ncbi:site-specific DNA-methyltransferase (adenine-specific) [Enterococcus sp. AZ170]|uniref:DNA-methyltransferase n=1 Tax=Enterococcus sp. AZ170 TaxID=2774747 RepID=UPI003D2FE8CB
MLELNKIYNMDCLVGMQQLPDKSIDMILCDLPYGTTQNKWDSIIPLEQLWQQYERIIKDNGAIVLTSQAPFDKVLAASNLKLLRYEWIWEKTSATGHLNANKMPMKAHENVLVFYKKLPVYNPQMLPGKPYVNKSGRTTSKNYGKFDSSFPTENLTGERYPRSVLTFKKDVQKPKIHPTQKPVALFEYLIKTYTNEGDLVFDGCSGSGTTAVAAINTNRKFLCMEKEKEYFDKSIERLIRLDGDQ